MPSKVASGWVRSYAFIRKIILKNGSAKICGPTGAEHETVISNRLPLSLEI